MDKKGNGGDYFRFDVEIISISLLKRGSDFNIIYYNKMLVLPPPLYIKG